MRSAFRALSGLLTLGLSTALAAASPRLWRLDDVPTANAPKPIRVVVVTPPGYAEEKERRYPVLYFLHDAGGDESVLVRTGIAADLVARMERKELPPFLLVAPRGVGTWFVDSYGGETRMATFLADELVPYVDIHYRTLATREGRVVAGISMGGYGALRWGLTHGETFVEAGGLSPAVQQLEWRGVMALPFFVRPSVTNVLGNDELRNNLRQNDLYDLLLTRPSLAKGAPRIRVRAGTEDRYRIGEVATVFKRTLDAYDIPNELILEKGIHDWDYWRRAFPDFVKSLVGSFGS